MQVQLIMLSKRNSFSHLIIDSKGRLCHHVSRKRWTLIIHGIRAPKEWQDFNSYFFKGVSIKSWNLK